MTEYQEAISRLNIQERTPGVTISRSQFPIERKDTPWNYDRILRETLNTPLPKYSIPQRLFINNDGSTSYTFPLDKQFTLAKGGRKSIAIREVNLTPDLNVTGNDNFHPSDSYQITITGNLEYKLVAAQQWTQWNINVNGTLNNNHKIPLSSYYINASSSIATGINNAINTQLGTQGINYATALYYEKGPCVQLNSTHNGYNFRFGNNITGVITNNRDTERVNLFNLSYNESYNFEVLQDENIIRLTVPPEKSFDSPYNLCSTINPWSPANIISSVDNFYPNLNKLFPYDNQQEVKLWFTNRYSKPMNNKFLSGYIDIELIIDNLNNFAMDD